MKSPQAGYQVVPNPKLQRFIAGGFRLAQQKPKMHGLVEVDVTVPLAVLRERLVKTGEALSFTAFLIARVAKAVDENKAVQAYRQGSKRLILFEEVAVYYLMEREVAGQRQPMPSSSARPTARPCARCMRRSRLPRRRTRTTS